MLRCMPILDPEHFTAHSCSIKLYIMSACLLTCAHQAKADSIHGVEVDVAAVSCELTCHSRVQLSKDM